MRGWLEFQFDAATNRLERPDLADRICRAHSRSDGDRNSDAIDI